MQFLQYIVVEASELQKKKNNSAALIVVGQKFRYEDQETNVAVTQKQAIARRYLETTNAARSYAYASSVSAQRVSCVWSQFDAPFDRVLIIY